MIRSSKQRGSLESRRPVQGDGLDCRNSPWSCPGEEEYPGPVVPLSLQEGKDGAVAQWERASLAWKRPRVQSPPAPP